jgi:glycosyltransferase involved in cell wall biosynthesis
MPHTKVAPRRAAYCAAVADPLKVLWLAKGLGPGGAERLLVALAEHLQEGRFDVCAAYLLAEKAHLVPQLRAAGADTVCLGGSGSGAGWAGRFRRLVAETRPDVVHVHAPQPAAVARPVVRSFGRDRPALVYTEHNTWGGYRLATRLANAATYPLDDHRLVVSEEALRSIPRLLRSRSEVLVHGIDLDAARAHAERRDALRAELGVGQGEVLVVTVANLREHKDYPTLLAAARLVAASGLPVRFAAVGQGPLEGRVAAEVDRLGFGGSFSLLGYRPDALDVVAAADVFCLSSRAEGYPVALMEALALGRPVVATAVGGVAHAVRSGVEGLLVAPSSPQALAAALVEVAGDPARREAMGRAAARRAALFDVARAAQRHAELYEELSARRGRR